MVKSDIDPNTYKETTSVVRDAGISRTPPVRNTASPDMMFSAAQTDGDLFAKWQLDTTPALEKLYHQIQGHIFNKETSQWVEGGDPIITEKGAIEIISYLDSHFSQFFSLSRLSESEIKRVSKQVRFWICNFILLNHDKYNILKEKADWLVDITDHTIYVNLKRSEKGFQAELMSIQQRIVESYQQKDAGDQEQKKRGGIFNLFKKGG